MHPTRFGSPDLETHACLRRHGFSGLASSARPAHHPRRATGSSGPCHGRTPLPQGSGRTDAGVHALAQVASFALRAPIPPENLHRALNRTLPPSIRVSETRTARSTFHARHSAIAKTYEYRIFCSSDCPPFLARYVYACPWPLSLDALQACARLFKGEHDFQSFAATDPDLAHRSAALAADHADAPTAPSTVESPESTVRTIFSSAWEQRSTDAGGFSIYRVRGNGFLHHMVRNLVGAMIESAAAISPWKRFHAFSRRAAAPPPAPRHPREACFSTQSTTRWNHSPRSTALDSCGLSVYKRTIFGPYPRGGGQHALFDTDQTD